MNKILTALFLIVFTGGFSQPTMFYPKGIGGGGALYFPTINPANDDEFYISCDMSELFHSVDFGKSYSQLPFTSLPVLSTSTYEFTGNQNIAYSLYNDGNEGYPVKTTDGGISWTMLTGFDAGLGKVYRIVARYNNPSQVIMGYYGDIVISNDGGSTFSLVKHAAYMGAGIILGGVVFDGNDIYIGTNEGVFHSSDNGLSFIRINESGIPPGQVIWNFTGAKSGNTLRFLCITSDENYTYNGIMPWDYYNLAKGVYSMDNVSGTWISKSDGISFSSDFIMYAGMAGNDINIIYLGGSDNALNAPLILKSSDGGTTWDKIFRTTNNENIETGWCGEDGDKVWSWAETCFGLAVSPYNSNKVVFGDYSYVHVTSDGGNSWTEAYVDEADKHPAGQPTPKKQPYHTIGLENTSCWQVTWSSAENMFGAFSDIGGIRSEDHGQTWGYNYNGFSVNSLYRITNLPNGTLFAATSRVHDLYQSTRLKDAQLDVSDATGNIYFSSDGSSTWSLLHNFGHPVFWIAIDPGNPGRMYASVVNYGGGGSSSQGGIWMTNDLENLASAQWVHLPAPPRTEGHPASIEVLNDGKMVCTFSGRINPSGSFTPSSGVFIYDPGTNSWTDVSDPGMYYWTKDIIIDPNDMNQNTWFAGVFSGWGGPPNGLGGLYKTTNRGVTWVKVTGNNFDRVTSLTYNPQNLHQAYLTTETQGLWVSQDMENPVPAWTLVDSYIFRQPERVFFNPFNTNEMWVTSFGNGLKTGNLIPSAVPEMVSEETVFSVFPNPAKTEISLVCTNPFRNCYTGKIISLTGTELKNFTIDLTQGKFTINIMDLPSGCYFLLITDQEKTVGKLKIFQLK